MQNLFLKLRIAIFSKINKYFKYFNSILIQKISIKIKIINLIINF